MMRPVYDIVVGKQPTQCSVKLRLFTLSLLLSMAVYGVYHQLKRTHTDTEVLRSLTSRISRWRSARNHTPDVRREPSIAAATTVGATEPWRLQPGRLPAWCQKYLEDSSTHTSSYRQAVDDTIVDLLRIFDSNESLLAVDRMVKGGSYEKGTDVPGRSDVDLVVFVSPAHLPPILEAGTETYRRRLADVLPRAEKAVARLSNLTYLIVDDVSWLTFKRLARVGGDLRHLTFDLFLTADNHMGAGHDLSEMFSAMLEQGTDPLAQQLHSFAMVEYQLSFVRGQPASVRSLIRLLKYWMYAYLPEVAQGSFRIELATILLWQEAGSPDVFSKAQGLKGVLQSLARPDGLRGYWPYLYDADIAERAIAKLEMKRPIILNPAIPTQNVLDIYQLPHNMAALRTGAEWALRTPLLKDLVVRPNWMD